jgi:regulator of sigma E protease
VENILDSSGGYVKMKGDANAASMPEVPSGEESRDTLHGQSPLKKIAVSLAGPLANYLLAFVLFFFLFVSYGKMSSPAVVKNVVENSIARQIGLAPDDKILSFNGEHVKDLPDMAKKIHSAKKAPWRFSVLRGEEILTFSAPKEMVESNPHQDKLGIESAVVFEKEGFFSSLSLAFREVFRLSWEILKNIGGMFSGEHSFKNMGGALMMAKLSGDVFAKGFFSLIAFAALLSVNLGLLNLLPIPVLDGGHVVIYSIEGIFGRALSTYIVEKVYFVGMLLLVGLMVFATWNDVKRLKILQFFKNLF